MSGLSADAVIALALADPHPAEAVSRLQAWLASGLPAASLRPALLAALQSGAAPVRRRAVRLAASVPGEEEGLGPHIRAALSDPAWTVREAAASACAQLPDGDGVIHVRLIEVSLHDCRPQVRAAAAQAAAPRMQPEHDYGAALEHPFERQRMRAAAALGFAQTKAGDAVQLLTTALGDSHVRVRRAAAQALADLPLSAVRPLLPVLLRKCFETDRAIASIARQVGAALLAEETDPRLAPVRECLNPSAAEEGRRSRLREARQVARLCQQVLDEVNSTGRQ